jgi:methyl-accepting chemotaxis protein
MSETKWKRRKILVDKEFQFRYLMTWVALTTSLLAGLVLASLSVFIFFGTGDRTVFILMNGGCAAVIAAVSMYYIVVHSHRVAGPAFRLKRVIGDLASGRRGFRVKLRRKDYLKDVADSLNVLIEKIEEKDAKINALSRELAEASGGNQEVARRVSQELSELCPAMAEVKVDGEEKKA